MIDSMNIDPIVFAMANPNPEISYKEIKKQRLLFLVLVGLIIQIKSTMF